MNIEELYAIIALPKPPTQTFSKSRKNDKIKKKKNLKNFFEKINFFQNERIRRNSTSTTCTFISTNDERRS